MLAWAIGVLLPNAGFMGVTGLFPSNLKSLRRIHSHVSFNRRGFRMLGTKGHQFPSTDGPFRNNRGRRRMSRMSVFLLPSFNMFNRWRFKKDLLTGGWRERGVGRRLEIEAPREEHSERLRRGVSNYGTF